ncbi:hypothetical protein [Caulobacter sp. NIBR1757]|uniref:hypothetical protein n=1 Tax=Caulobacter sp. NIBR1757 TaxID=3016000 RepID=UPI0022F0E8E7|nr:hypothetical protein [Caulobacter sp. NIBR1757]WGM38378.1 hypothetical protein AMEJIAPC_01281 [Caulobacter sp. NIBR1757]
MTRLLALTLAALLTLPAAAQAAPAPAPAKVDAAFGNTVLIVDPDGRSRKIWLQPGGAWTGLSRRGLDLAGKWTVKGRVRKQGQPGPLYGSGPNQLSPAKWGEDRFGAPSDKAGGGGLPRLTIIPDRR